MSATDDGAALLAAIIANPDEDTPRLVYADWLQENGQEERAEFIRSQCNGSNGKKTNSIIGTWFNVFGRGFEVTWRSSSLFLWSYGELPRNSATIRRGFIDRIRCTAAEWLVHADAILAQHPVRHVALTTNPDDLLNEVRRSDRNWKLAPGLRRGSVIECWRAEWPHIKFHSPTPVADVVEPEVFRDLLRSMEQASATGLTIPQQYIHAILDISEATPPD